MPAYGRDEVAMMADDGSELARLRVENARLVELSTREADDKEAIHLELRILKRHTANF
jgi:hypothetical protein